MTDVAPLDSRRARRPGPWSDRYGLVGAEVEAADSGLCSLVSVQGSLAMQAIHTFGSAEQKQKWLPHWVLDGTKMWITNGSVAAVAIVWAQTEDGIRGSRFGIIVGAMRAARDSLETAISYADTRVQFDRAIAGFQLTQATVADLTADYVTGMLLSLRRSNR